MIFAGWWDQVHSHPCWQVPWISFVKGTLHVHQHLLDSQEPAIDLCLSFHSLPSVESCQCFSGTNTCSNVSFRCSIPQSWILYCFETNQSSRPKSTTRTFQSTIATVLAYQTLIKMVDASENSTDGTSIVSFLPIQCRIRVLTVALLRDLSRRWDRTSREWEIKGQLHARLRLWRCRGHVHITASL